jgi:hypothetical protein
MMQEIGILLATTILVRLFIKTKGLLRGEPRVFTFCVAVLGGLATYLVVFLVRYAAHWI